MAKKEGTLTPMQRKFVEEYIKDYNGTRSYKEVYNLASDDRIISSKASTLLKKPEIQEYLHRLQDEAVKAAGITASKILIKLDEIVNDPKASRGEKMKAMDLLSKNLGLQTQKVETTAKIVVINIDDEDDDNTD